MSSEDELSDLALAMDAAVFAERVRLIAERTEDLRRAEAGELPLDRPPVPIDRKIFVTVAEAELKAKDVADEAEKVRIAALDLQTKLARRAILEAELDTLRDASVLQDPNPSSSSKRASGARFTLAEPQLADLFTKPLSAPGSFYDLIGVSNFLSAERSDVKLEHSSMQVISKADRLKLSASDKSKIYASFIKGTTNKFKATSTIENITSFAELQLELRCHITSISVHPVFLILRFDQAGDLINPDTTDGAPINLLSINSLPPLCDVEKLTLFHYKRGSLFNQENLVWSLDAVCNSCDKDLQAIIDAKMLKYKVSKRFGPLYYYELVQQMTDVDSKAVRAITRELTSLKIPDPNPIHYKRCEHYSLYPHLARDGQHGSSRH